LDLTFSGFEQDLLMLSLAIVGIGILSLVTLLIINLRKRRHFAQLPNMKEKVVTI